MLILRSTHSLSPVRALRALLLLTSSALAEPAEPGSQAEAPTQSSTSSAVEGPADAARDHFQRGVAFYNDGDAKLALVEFRRAYELSKNARILFNIGQVHAELEQHARALTAFERYLKDGGAEVSDERRAAVERDLQELERKVARVEVRVNVAEAELWVDGELAGTARPDLRLVMDAGEHRLEARRAGHTAVLQQLTLVGGERSRVGLTLRRERPLVVVRRETVPKASSAPQRPKLWLGWVATGVLAAGAAGTGAAAALRANDLAELRSSPDSTAAERQRTADETRTLAVTADALTIATAALAGTTLVLGLRHRSRERRPISLGITGHGVVLVSELP